MTINDTFILTSLLKRIEKLEARLGELEAPPKTRAPASSRLRIIDSRVGLGGAMTPNGFEEYRRLITFRLDQHDAAMLNVSRELSKLIVAVSELKTQRNTVSWVAQLGLPALIAAAVSVAVALL